jgi:hypothetical protein
MKVRVESSQLGDAWSEGDHSLRFTRIGAEFESKDTLESIAEVVKQAVREQGTRIEYSTDKGFSYSPLRINLADPTGRITAAVIADLINKNYRVRYLAINDKDKGHPQGVSLVGDIIAEASRTKTNPTIYEKVTKEEITYAKIFTDGSHIRFRQSSTKPESTSGTLAIIENVNVFKMDRPNRTRTIWQIDSDNTIIKNLPGISRGHAYDVRFFRRSLGTDIPTLEKLLAMPIWKSKQLLEVTSARNFDEESRSIFTGITIATVLSGKYNVAWGSFYKFGTKWYIQAKDLAKFVSIVYSIGGYVEFPNLLDDNWLLIKENKEADLEEVMKLHILLGKMLNDDNQNETFLAETLAATIDYRNEVVDNIIKLNETIKQASDRLAEKKADEAISRLTPPA